MSHRSLFSHRSFRLLLVGQTASQLGTQMSAVAIPLLAVVTLHATAFEVGVLNAAATIAFALVGLPAGAWLDRWRRRRILILSDVLRALLLATIPLVASTGSLDMRFLIGVSFLVGCARVFFDVGYQSLLPDVIGRERVLAGNSSMEFIRATGQVTGPGLGGVLVTFIGAANVVLAQAATFAVSAITLAGVHVVERAAEERAAGRSPGDGRRRRLGAEVGEGLHFVAANHVLRATALASACSNVSFAIASSVSIIFLARDLELSPFAIGCVIAAASVAAMLGAVVTPRLAAAVGSARVIWWSLAVTTPFTLLVVIAQPGWWIIPIVASMAAGEFGQIVYAVANVSLRQRLCPDRLLGRVNATIRFAVMALFPLGAVVGGLLGELLGTRTTLFIAGLIALVAPALLWPPLRGVRDVEELPRWQSGVAGPNTVER